MAVRGVRATLRGVFNAVFRPQQFVEFQTATYESSRFGLLRQVGTLLGVYLANLVTYALPLTIAGVGIRPSRQPPAGFATLTQAYGVDPTASWQLGAAFVQNSLFISVATVLTLFTFHAGLLVVNDSEGIVQSMHTVVYTTSAYLIAAFTAVWYLTNQSGVGGARVLVRNLQASFVYVIIDLVGVGLELPGGRPDALVSSAISTQGQWILAILVITLLYYLFSLYLGARINHQTSRSNAVLVVTAVTFSPVVYVAGSILAYLIGLT